MLDSFFQTVAPPKTHWRQKHQEFINNVRAARGAQVAIDHGLPLPPPPPPSENPGSTHIYENNSRVIFLVRFISAKNS